MSLEFRALWQCWRLDKGSVVSGVRSPRQDSVPKHFAFGAQFFKLLDLLELRRIPANDSQGLFVRRHRLLSCTNMNCIQRADVRDLTAGKHFLVREAESTLRWVQNIVNVYLFVQCRRLLTNMELQRGMEFRGTSRMP